MLPVGFRVFAAVVASLATAVRAAPPDVPPDGRIPDLVNYEGWYGVPVQVPLTDLSSPLGNLQRKVVRTTGLFERTMDGAYRLTDGLAQVLLIPVMNLDRSDVSRQLGRRVEVVGFTRELPERQGTCKHRGADVPESLCRDWILPPVPDRAGHANWPLNSITFWSVVDATSMTKAGDTTGAPASALSAIVQTPERFVGETVTVLGRFRGANLFADLKDASRLSPSDWVLSDGGAAVWIVGKPPRGDGWALSLDSKADERWWVEVTGKIEMRGPGIYLRAKKIELKKPEPPAKP